MSYLKCLPLDEVEYIMMEIHTKEYAAIIQGKKVWHRKSSDKGTTSRPCRGIQQNLFRSVTNSKGLLMS